MEKEIEWLDEADKLSLKIRARIYDIEFENILRERELNREKDPVSIGRRLINSVNAIGQSIINNIKRKTDRMERLGESFVDLVVSKYNALDEVDFSFRNKKFVGSMAVGLSVLAITVISTGKMAYDKTHAAYDVFYKGRRVFSVRTIDDLNKAVKAAEASLTEEKDIAIRLEKPFKFEESLRDFDEISTSEDIHNFIASETRNYGFGYEVLIKGERLSFVANKDVMQEVYSSLISHFVPYENRETADILEDVTFVEKKLNPRITKDSKALEEILLSNIEEAEFYQVEAGESLAIISGITGVPYEDLLAFNQELANMTSIPEGRKVRLTGRPVLTVVSTKPVERQEEIIYETEIIEDSSIYKNKKFTKVEGQNGEKTVKELEYYENGVKVGTKLVDEITTIEPVKKVVVQGTKDLPKYMATGKLTRPTRGRFTSGFGTRWGRMHKGIDIAGSYGTAIKAADSGTVVFTGWYYGLGKMVKINHGNGMVTVYGHLSSINVKNGQKVLKGEKIGGMGSTGRSTGVHLHFEVIKNGVHQNPLKYIGY
ncbi:MAG: peptidoglycan DD-metalloendopeptidase family protein [Tissierellia bacterium]|nr:peptidoglycan DD-metalloendopeptidase family protein [Tissierellia bacterium]